jgi:hypothetical protein
MSVNNVFNTISENVQGVIVISGIPGSGKTTAAMTIVPPDKQVVLDFDLKDEVRCKKLGIPYFRPQVETMKSATDYDLNGILAWSQTAFKSIAEEGKKGRDTLIIDNGSALEAAFAYAVLQNPMKYGVNPKNAQTGAYGGVNPGVAVLWQNTVKYFQSNGYVRIVVCMHMSQSWANGVPVDKMKVKGNKALTELSNLSVVLIKSNQPNHAPVGLVGKEALGLLNWDEKTNKYRIFMALPPRVPEFDWEHVAKYMDEFGSGKKTSFETNETWTMKEVEQFGPWLSDAQREFILTIARNPNFSLGDSDDSVVSTGEKQLLPAEDIKDPEPVIDWAGIKQYALNVNGMDDTELKKFIKDKFGGYKATDHAAYFAALKALPVKSKAEEQKLVSQETAESVKLEEPKQDVKTAEPVDAPEKVEEPVNG